MRRLGIYNDEQQIDSTLAKQRSKNTYKDWKTYVKTIEHYLSLKSISQ